MPRDRMDGALVLGKRGALGRCVGSWGLEWWVASCITTRYSIGVKPRHHRCYGDFTAPSVASIAYRTLAEGLIAQAKSFSRLAPRVAFVGHLGLSLHGVRAARPRCMAQPPCESVVIGRCAGFSSRAQQPGSPCRGGRTLDALAVATGVAFDKTGTLTVGSPALSGFHCVGNNSSDDGRHGHTRERR